MRSTVACIGFTDPDALTAIVRESGEAFHELSSTRRWRDSSGAMLLLDRTAQQARPAYDTDVRCEYSSLTAGASGLAVISLKDVTGYELDEFTVIPDARYTVGWNSVGRVALVAMGVDVEFFSCAEDYFASERSAMPGMPTDPPPEVAEFGLPWPPPMEIETLLPSERPDDPSATLCGTVQSATVHRNSLTGHQFLVTRVATVCGEVDLCSPLTMTDAPQPGAVVAARVQLLAGFTPYGHPDTSSYTRPEEPIGPHFADSANAPDGADAVVADEPIELPEGLVLGEDGIVRSVDEHQAWKSGDADAGGRPSATSAPNDSAESHPEDEHDERREFHGRIAPDEPDAPAAHGPGAEAPALTESDGDDSTPRPGETRRQWRARTGR